MRSGPVLPGRFIIRERLRFYRISKKTNLDLGLTGYTFGIRHANTAMATGAISVFCNCLNNRLSGARNHFLQAKSKKPARARRKCFIVKTTVCKRSRSFPRSRGS